MKTKFLIRLKSGLIFTSLTKPKETEHSISFNDKFGLYKSFPLDQKESVEEVEDDDGRNNKNN
jgi:hypothetical protein